MGGCSKCRGKTAGPDVPRAPPALTGFRIDPRTNRRVPVYRRSEAAATKDALPPALPPGEEAATVEALPPGEGAARKEAPLPPGEEDVEPEGQRRDPPKQGIRALERRRRDGRRAGLWL